MRSKHLKSQCLLHWKYSKLLCIRTLVKLSYHTSSAEAVHSQVIFSFMTIFNCFFLSYLAFILLFHLLLFWYWDLHVEDKVNKVVVSLILANLTVSIFPVTDKTYLLIYWWYFSSLVFRVLFDLIDWLIDWFIYFKVSCGSGSVWECSWPVTDTDTHQQMSDKARELQIHVSGFFSFLCDLAIIFMTTF